ncbi:phosphatase PAP2 family protein [Brevibacillus fluminis]|uniref:Phosphatase PAP2 family protein n=1 Tax=Brevibacillus fluminis TaxID=511487 RepID=A0A3M8DNB9_9BACL|nr:phosphatase PAP2 family protein [Brevibacillus fluminis]RNB89592.1 phosphatase PAP2 family protein [Brevibacillus fluminis]
MSAKTLSKSILLSIVSVIGFIFLASLVSRHALSHFDSAISAFVQGFEFPAITTVMKFLSFIGSPIPMVILSAIVLLLLYRHYPKRAEVYLFVSVMFLTILSNWLLKNAFKRARPDLHQLVHETGYSFPSGHSMTAFSFYGILAFLLWHQSDLPSVRLAIILVSTIMIAGIGISRIYLGVHYPSDVVGSYFFSGFVLAVGIWFYQRYQERHYLRSER